MTSGDGQWPVCTQCKQERCGQNAADRESSSGTVNMCVLNLLQIDNATFLVGEQFGVFLVVIFFLREEVKYRSTKIDLVFTKPSIYYF